MFKLLFFAFHVMEHSISVSDSLHNCKAVGKVQYVTMIFWLQNGLAISKSDEIKHNKIMKSRNHEMAWNINSLHKNYNVINIFIFIFAGSWWTVIIQETKILKIQEGAPYASSRPMSGFLYSGKTFQLVAENTIHIFQTYVWPSVLWNTRESASSK